MAGISVEKAKYVEYSGFQELRDKLTEEGFQVFTWQDAPGEYHSEHSHPSDEVVVVSSGKIIFTIGDASYELEPGDALNLPANTVHTASNQERMPACYFICTRTTEGSQEQAPSNVFGTDLTQTS